MNPDRRKITSALNIEVVFSTELLLPAYQTAQSDNVDQNVNLHRGENTLKMEVVFYTETLITVYSTTRRVTQKTRI
jgi:hypothetical protein